MKSLNVFGLLKKVRDEKPIVHHLTNWVTIYDCAQIVKTLGASPIMAHASEEVAEMAQIASSLVLNIGTLTVDFVESMKIAAKSANRKGIPVIIDICGAGATPLRDWKVLELLEQSKISVIKGNSSEVARIAGTDVQTKGVDAGRVDIDLCEAAKKLAKKYSCTVVVTGKEDIVADENKCYIVKNGHPLMTCVVGTGCMAASVIGAFAAIEKDLVNASVSALVSYEIAAECAAKNCEGPASFKNRLFDCLYNLDEKTVKKMQKFEIV